MEWDNANEEIQLHILMGRKPKYIFNNANDLLMFQTNAKKYLVSATTVYFEKARLMNM